MRSADILVFYKGELYEELSNEDLRLRHITWPKDVFETCHFFIQKQGRYKVFGPERGWYRGDGTPVLEVDVPKELRLLCLILI